MDKAGFFRGEDGALTQHGKRLKFYDISFVFANSPESKGKWSVFILYGRIVCLLILRENIDMCVALEDVSNHVESLVDYRNDFELHREIGMAKSNRGRSE